MLYKTEPIPRETLDEYYNIAELKQMCKKLKLKTEKQELIEKLVTQGVTYYYDNRNGMFYMLVC